MLTITCVIKMIEDESGKYWMGQCVEIPITITGDTFEEVFSDMGETISSFFEATSDEGLEALGFRKAQPDDINIKIEFSESLAKLASLHA